MSEKLEMNNAVEPDLQPGEVIDLTVGAALSRHVAAKSIAHVEPTSQEATMRDLVALASTREGLAAMQKIQSQE